MTRSHSPRATISGQIQEAGPNRLPVDRTRDESIAARIPGWLHPDGPPGSTSVLCDQLTRDGVVLAFEDAGKGAPPILLVHDPALDPTSMRPHLEHFRGTHRVVVPNLRGHGRSQGLRRTSTRSAVADDLAWLCYELGVYRPVAIGHRAGGMIALELAARCTDLLAAVVTLDAPIEPACPSRSQHAPAQGLWSALAVPRAADETSRSRIVEPLFSADWSLVDGELRFADVERRNDALAQAMWGGKPFLRIGDAP